MMQIFETMTEKKRYRHTKAEWKNALWYKSKGTHFCVFDLQYWGSIQNINGNQIGTLHSNDHIQIIAHDPILCKTVKDAKKLVEELFQNQISCDKKW